MSGARGPVAVVTDSTAYLPAGMVEEHGLTVVPLQVVVGGRSLAEGVDVVVVDSRSLAMGLGFVAVAAARAAREGADAEAAARVARRLAPEVGIWLYVDTLDYLRRGGRIGAAAAVVGSALSVKPLLHVVAGRLRARLPRARTVHVGEVGAVVGAHVGPGMLGVVVVPAT